MLAGCSRKFDVIKCFGDKCVVRPGTRMSPATVSVSHPSIKPSPPICTFKQIETSLTWCNLFCFYHPRFLLSSSVSLYISVSIFLNIFALLCSPTRLLATSLPCCSLAAPHWLCPLPEFHLCPRSASASQLHPPARPLRSRSSDRKKGPTTSASADAISDMTEVSRCCLMSTLKLKAF